MFLFSNIYLCLSFFSMDFVNVVLFVAFSSYTLPVSTCHFSESVKMGGALGKDNENSGSKPYVPESKLEAKMVKAMQRRESEGTAMKSFNSLILKFPKIDESLRKCKAIFEQFGGLFPHF